MQTCFGRFARQKDEDYYSRLDYQASNFNLPGAPIGSFREYICSEGLESPEIFGFNCRESYRFLWRNMTSDFRNKTAVDCYSHNVVMWDLKNNVVPTVYIRYLFIYLFILIQGAIPNVRKMKYYH